jgi:hypothetical protein
MRRAWMVALLAGCEGNQTLDDGGPTDEADCPSADDFVIGFEKSTPAGVVVTLVDAAPAPPYRGENNWTIGLTDPGGAPVSGAAPVVTPWMPLHNHGLSPPTYVGSESAAGSYGIESFELIMPGQWEFTVDAGGGDSVLYTFCVEG